MFTINHFIWLGIIVVLIATLLILNKLFKWSFDTNLTILVVVAILSELIKTIVCMQEQVGAKYTGWYLNPRDLPLHLCSIQIFFLFFLKFINKKKSTQDVLLSFMFPPMLLGGIIALFIPTVGVEFNDAQVYQFFLFHGFIVYFAIYLISNGIIKITFHTIVKNFIILFVLFVSILYVNSMLSVYEANYFYLSRPPMSNLPVLNLNHGWYVYVAHLISIASIALFALQLPFALINKSK